MTVIDKILSEWSYRCSDGIVDMNNPTKRAILNAILEENGVNKSDLEEIPLLESNIDSVIVGIYGKNIPVPTPPPELVIGTDFDLSGNDAKTFAELFEKTPSKGNNETSTRGSGNGEVSVYWLFSQSGFTVSDERGSDNPDLKINNVGVEVKAYDVATITLGKFAKDKASLKLLNIVFGLKSLVSTLEGDTKESNPANFHSNDLIQAFELMFKFLNNTDLRKMAEDNGIDIITEIFKKIDAVKKTLNLGTNDPRAATAALLRQLAINKCTKKPGMGGYILNVNKEGKGKWHYITEQAIKAASDDTIIDSVKINQAQIDMNFIKIFPKNK